MGDLFGTHECQRLVLSIVYLNFMQKLSVAAMGKGS
jgi:hypothetical protein